MTLKLQIQDATKAAMKGGDKERLSALRLLAAAIKQKEVDERIELDDAAVLSVIEKMVKQRRESVTQYQAGNRADLAAAEQAEIGILQAYMPSQMSADEIGAAVAAAISNTGATGMRDMGKVMAKLKTELAGRADMTAVSTQVKAALAG